MNAPSFFVKQTDRPLKKAAMSNKFNVMKEMKLCENRGNYWELYWH